MRFLKASGSLDNYFQNLEKSRRSLLLLDYDGTLAPFQKDRMQAVPYPGIREMLVTLLGQSRTRLVIVSGRPVREITQLLALDIHPEIWGSHGWERCLPGEKVQIAQLEPEMERGLREAQDWAGRQGLDRLGEAKTGCYALHTRPLDPGKVESVTALIEKHWSPLASQYGLSLRRFDGGLELRAPGRDKGFAVRSILTEVEHDTPVAYLGDDQTDEDAFLALQGRGLSVLVRDELRETAADLWLQPPHELREFLSRWRDVASRHLEFADSPARAREEQGIGPG